MFRKLIFGSGMSLLVATYILIPACGNKQDNAQPPPPPPPPVGPGGCIPGQICNNVPGGGVPLMQGPSFSSLDYQGSAMALNFSAAGGYPAGQAYSGQVNIAGSIRLARPCYNLPAGEYPVQGQGVWQSGYGGAIARVQGQLQMNGGSVYLGPSLIKFGQDPLNPQGQPQGYYLQGQVYIGPCNGTFTAL